ncbi:hypothetical protein GIB67_010185 [Kingdonia uniflora]|uniref:Uncharacterized protein n=1 Tax=Kingdonia uniflora TaxID=39325 RepID=A0A7J7NAP0_9MAGN|nr:hypothetical protein GIB67_010185 [Kingdonia uniflora]
MHDLCFIIPYGLILVAGGVIRFAKKGSIALLTGGSRTGFLLLLAGYLNLKAFEKRKSSYLVMFLEIVVVAAGGYCYGATNGRPLKAFSHYYEQQGLRVGEIKKLGRRKGKMKIKKFTEEDRLQ